MRHHCVSVFVIWMCLLHSAFCDSSSLPDHLVPPPLPTPQRLTHANAPSYTPIDNQLPPVVPSEEDKSGLMNRIARWFGLGAQEQQLISESQQNVQFQSLESNKQAYFYPKPNQQQQQQQHPQQQSQGKKETCNLCNKYPWVPMLPPTIQYPLAQQYQQSNQQWAQASSNVETQASLQTNLVLNKDVQSPAPVKQRAVQFHFPNYNNFHFANFKDRAPNSFSIPQYAGVPFMPIPVPNLSASVLPPLYNAQPFRPSVTVSTESTISEQHLPSTEPAQFIENVGAHSELRPDRVVAGAAGQVPVLSNQSGKDASFEIVQSHQLTDFVASVEYPATLGHSQTLDLVHKQVTENHKTTPEPVSSVNYQHKEFSPNLSHHIPASQILTELGNFAGKSSPPSVVIQETIQQLPSNHDQTVVLYAPQSELQHSSNTADNHEVVLGDNFPSASSHNVTALPPNHNFDNWHQYQQSQSNELFFTSTITSTELSTNSEFTAGPTSTAVPPQTETNYVTEGQRETTYGLFANPQTISTVQSRPLPTSVTKLTSPPSQPHINYNNHRYRETPKRLLDSPIQHNWNRSDAQKPFTKDPGDLNFRVGPHRPHEFHHSNHAYATSAELSAPWSPTSPSTTRQPLTTIAMAALPTPTSGYSALDASGQFAGIAPPAPPSSAPDTSPHNLQYPTKTLHQIVIPYTTKNQPRPFEPTKDAWKVDTTTRASAENTFENWSLSTNAIDLHEQQESKVVTTATAIPPNNRQTTRYLTKILASNLRELLRREHEIKSNRTKILKPKNKPVLSHGFDVVKLRKNIDDWTEQEYTSLSHRASTPTIRGRSKHIPTEYLTTTTPSPRLAKTTRGKTGTSELPTSINNLEPLLIDRGSKRFDYIPIDDNRLLDDGYDSTPIHRRTTPVPRQTSTPFISPSLRPEGFTPFSSSTEHNHVHVVPVEDEPAKLWEKTKVLISPKTQEKVYVVTPQPLYFPQRSPVEKSESPSKPVTAESMKVPRFLARPSTDGTKNKHINTSYYSTPDLFGLMGLSAFVPKDPPEIIDGNSKVTTTATSAPNHVTADPKIDSVKTKTSKTPMMSPSPR